MTNLQEDPHLDEDADTTRLVAGALALAKMMVAGDKLIDAASPYIQPADFVGVHRIICKVLLQARQMGVSVEPGWIKAMFYPEERAGEIQGILRLYEILCSKNHQQTPSEAVASLRDVLRHLRHDETALYLWYDADEVLLYVGITKDLATRQSKHVKRSSWAAFADHSKVRRYRSRLQAERAETLTIETEQPLFNHTHNDTPEARQRLVEYLIKHGRTDLLAPAVSRG